MELALVSNDGAVKPAVWQQCSADPTTVVCNVSCTKRSPYATISVYGSFLGHRGKQIMDKEWVDRTKSIQQRLVELRDSL
jgi:hypothetical protein